MTALGSPSAMILPASMQMRRLGHLQQDVDDVLDPHDGDAAASQLEDRADQLLRLGVGQPAADLVEQQQRRLGRQRARKLEPLAVEQAERLGAAVGDAGHAAQLERRDGVLIGLVAAEIGAMRGGDEDVLERRHAAERLWNLVRAHEPEPAALRGRARRDVRAPEFDAAGVRRETPRRAR